MLKNSITSKKQGPECVENELFKIVTVIFHITVHVTKIENET